ncbi:MAG: hypothetical protein WBD87_05205 [Candidatus Acidiferrales bacterium]
MVEEAKSNKNSADESETPEQLLLAETEERSGWREIFREAFDKARRDHRPANRNRLSRDHSRSLFLLAGAAITVLLLFLVVFSSPNRRRLGDVGWRGTPNLGQRPTSGQQTSGQIGSTTPLLNAQTETPQTGDAKEVTARDVNNTARPIESSFSNRAQFARRSVTDTNGPYALGQINLSDIDARESSSQPDFLAKHESDDLRKPSLVFVRNAQDAFPSRGAAAVGGGEPEEELNRLELPAGTRLVARLQSVVTSAVKAPIIAAIEYNYERDGQIIVPAGAKALGSLQQAGRSGNVDMRFHSIQMPDGTIEKIEATAMSLTYGPLKGVVSGKKSGANFLVRAFTGLGEAATYLVGAGGLSAPLSESALLRDRIASNIGIASDQELDSLTLNQDIVVTVPGNTRFYIVMQEGTASPETPAQLAATHPVNNATAPSLDELRQMLQLRQEMNAIYQQPGSAQSPALQAPQP